MSILHPRAGGAGSRSAGLGQLSKVEHHGHVRGLLAGSGVGQLGASAVPKLLGLKERERERERGKKEKKAWRHYVRSASLRIAHLVSAQGLSEDKALFERIT